MQLSTNESPIGQFRAVWPNTAPLRGISDVQPIPDNVRRGRGGGKRRVFRQFP
jgi:hypothetical protein